MNDTPSTPTQPVVDRLLEELKGVVHDGQELLKAGAGELTERGREAKARLEVALERAKATCENYQDKAAEGLRVTDQAIRDHPYASIGIAFGVGVLIGVLVNRR